MQLIDTWIARLRGKAVPKERQSVLTFDRYELMTATQALRFEELQSTAASEMLGQNASLPEQPWYALDDACDLLAVDESTVLRAAAEGRVRFFVYSKSGAANFRQPIDLPEASSEFLVLPTSNCHDLLVNGVSDVCELIYVDMTGNNTPVALKRPQRVNLQTVYLKHPLPEFNDVSS